LGNRQQKHFLRQTHYPTFHTALRWDYISRKRVVMLRTYGWHFPHWFFSEMAVTITGFIRMLLFENQRRLKIKAFIYGTRDGLMQRMGEMPLKTRKILIPVE